MGPYRPTKRLHQDDRRSEGSRRLHEPRRSRVDTARPGQLDCLIECGLKPCSRGVDPCRHVPRWIFLRNGGNREHIISHRAAVFGLGLHRNTLSIDLVRQARPPRSCTYIMVHFLAYILLSIPAVLLHLRECNFDTRHAPERHAGKPALTLPPAFPTISFWRSSPPTTVNRTASTSSRRRWARHSSRRCPSANSTALDRRPARR